MIAATSADLIYDAETHTSKLPDGRDVPHVTHVLGATGVTTDFSALSDLHPRIRANVQFARERGSAVHEACHFYDDGDLRWDTVDPRVVPYVEAWAVAREGLCLEPVSHGRERHVFNSLHIYTGIQDGVFLRRSGLGTTKRILADIKTGDPFDAAAEFQTAAYEGAWDCEHPHESINERWSIWLRPGLRVPYKVENYTAWPDSYLHFQHFLAFLTTYNAQAVRRKR